MKIYFSALALVALFLSAVTALATINPALQMQTGNPSAAATDPIANRTNFLIQRAQYAFGYNDTTREPNWVAWNLTSGDVGSSGRSPDFFQDTTLPAGFYQVLPTDYSGSGYDRGHLCPSGDRTVTRADNDVVFFMSNMMPQAPDNNQGVWASFETYCRTLADTGNEVLIIAGPGGFAGSTIASGVSIPGFTWKIAVVVPLGAGTALSRITATTRVIAIKIPNTAGVRSNPWQQYVTSTTQLQTDTGYTFFTDPALAAVAAALRAQVDGQTATGAPTITTPPSTQTTAVGGSAIFSVAATSNPASTLTYQWLKHDDAITGNTSATTATLTLTNVQAADAAIYTVVVTNPIGSVTSSGAALVITGLPPVIATPPASLTKVAGTTAVFTVSATGSPTLAYQWRKGGTNLTNTANITGATSATLTVTNVQASDAATYNVIVANPTLPNATSAGATLTVTAAAPTITLPPATQTAVVGNLTTFTVIATGTAPFTYQWRKGGTPVTNGVTGNGSTLTGATTATLTMTNTQLTDAGNFDVVVANGLNPDATSAVAVLTVSAVATPSTVAWNFGAGAGTESAAPTSGLPADVTGGTVTSGNNNGTPTLVTAVSVANTYSDFSAGNNAGVAAQIGALNTAAAGSAFFEFTLTPTANKQLSVSALTFGTRSTSTGPQAYSIFSNADNYTTAVATGTLSATSVWALQSPVLTAVTGTTGAAITFRIYGHSGAGSPAANTANWRIDDLKVTLNTAAGAPLIPAVTATTPVTAATGVAGNAPITVTFNQSVTVATGWFTINSALTGGIAATVTGGPTTYTFTPPVNFTDNDTVTVTIVAAQITDTATNTLHPAANTVLTFTTAAAVAPTITTAPTAQTANAGTSATFTVVASGTTPFSYQWRKNAVNITGHASATTSTLIFPNVQAADASAGPYDVVVTNSVSSITSAAVALTVIPTAPTITTAPVAATLLYGNNATFTVVASGTSPFSYQWRKGGVPLVNGAVTNAATVSGATGATLTLTAITTADAGNYDVIVTNSVASATPTTAVALTVTLPPAGPQTNYAGGTYVQNFDGLPATGTFTFTGPGPYALEAAQPNGVGASGLAGWSFAKGSGSGSVALFKFDNGASNSGATHAYGTTSAPDRALGSLSSGTFAARYGISFVNTTGQTLSTFTLGYTGEQWRHGGALIPNKLAFSYATGAIDLNTVATGGFTAATALDFTAPIFTATTSSLDGNLAVNRVVIAPVTITGLTWAPGQTLVLRWTDVDDAGSDDGLGIDDLTFSAEITLTPGKLAQSIAFTSTITAQLSTAGPFTLVATATSGLPITFTLVSGPATVSDNTLTLTGAAGTVVVRASQVGNSSYNAAAPVDLSFAVAQPPFTYVTPRITTQPFPQVAQTGGTAAFSVTATGTPAPTYQWRQNGTDLAGATSAALTLANVQSTDAGGYDVVVTNIVRSVISSLARLTVSATATAPVFTRQPGNVVALAGRSATFTVVATGAPAPTYQWTKHGTALTGATAATLTIADLRSSDSGAYSVTVTNSAGTVTSSTATLRVIARSYAGTYIGTIPAQGGPGGSTGGTFALLVNGENSGVLLAFERISAFLDDLPSGGYFAHTVTSIAQGFSISDSGAFDFTAAAYRPAAASTGGVMPVPAPPATTTSALMIRPVSVTGSISESGALRGMIAGSSSLSAQKSPDTGSAPGFAGFYTAGSSSNSSQLFAIVSPDGKAVVVVLSNDDPVAGAPASFVEGLGRNRLAIVLPDRTFGVDAGTGTVDSLGRLSITTPTAQVLVVVLAPETRGITAAVTTAAGTTTTFAGFADNSAALAQQRIVNLSTRTTAGSGDQVAIVGFVVTGLESKPVLLRAVGPALRGLGVTTALAAPRLELRANGVLLATNTGWTTTGNAAEIANAAARSGAFPLAVGSADSVILTTLAPGTYTALMSASDARSGVGLVEIYDLSGGSLAQKLSNLSIRAAVGTGESTLISGLVVGGSAPKRVLIRAAGPSLTQFGVTGALPRPALSLFSATGAVLAQNSGWSTSADAAEIANAAARVGAFVFGATSADSALILNLPSGAYTAQVTGVAGATGTALLEVYELP